MTVCVCGIVLISGVDTVPGVVLFGFTVPGIVLFGFTVPGIVLFG